MTNLTQAANQKPANEVQIHIDQKLYPSPSPTTGEALYRLGNVQTGKSLYREVAGNLEDVPVPNDSSLIDLKQGEHFRTDDPRTYRIIINAQPFVVNTKFLTYEQILNLAFPNPPTGPNIRFTIGYEDGPHANPQGSLMPGDKVKVQDGMIFHVTPTDKS